MEKRLFKVKASMEFAISALTEKEAIDKMHTMVRNRITQYHPSRIKEAFNYSIREIKDKNILFINPQGL